MKTAITLAVIEFRLTTYNDDGVQVKEETGKFAVAEIDIPEAVKKWIAEKTGR